MFGSTGATFASMVNTVMTIIYSLEWLLAGIAVVVFLWGMATFVKNAGDSKGRQMSKNLIIWGILALFVLFSIQGILWLMCGMLGNGACTSRWLPNGAPTYTNPQQLLVLR